MTFVKPNKTKKQNQTDRVMTPEKIALQIVKHFNPKGKKLEPAMGTGSFHKYLKGDWCEIDKGRDFFNYHKKIDWIITNPPYSIYDDFLLHSLEIADNVVFLVPLAKAFKSQKIQKAINKYGGLKEILMMGSGGNVGFKFGFPVGCLYYKRGYKGKIKLVS